MPILELDSLFWSKIKESSLFSISQISHKNVLNACISCFLKKKIIFFNKNLLFKYKKMYFVLIEFLNTILRKVRRKTV